MRRCGGAAVRGCGGVAPTRSICFTDDPTSGYGMLFACIIGVGEIGVIVSAQSLASKRAPGPRRGTLLAHVAQLRCWFQTCGGPGTGWLW